MRRIRLRDIARAGEIFRCRRVTRQWIELTLAYLRLKPISSPLQVALKGGGHLTVEDSGDGDAFWQIFVRRIYAVLPSDRVIVDAGANVGMFTLYAALVAPEAMITAIEPFPSSHGRLVACVNQNNISSRVRALRCALGGKNGKAIMDASPGVDSQARRVLEPWMESAAPITVDLMTLDAVFEKATKIDLLKMDIQGKEYEVLKASSLRSVQRIVVEYHEVHAQLELTKETLFSDLTSKGLGLVWDSSPGISDGVAEFRR